MVLDGRANFIADNLIAEEKMVPMLIAMPNNQSFTGAIRIIPPKRFPLFEEELKKQIIPFVEKNIQHPHRSQGRALAGLSMGDGIRNLLV